MCYFACNVPSPAKLMLPPKVFTCHFEATLNLAVANLLVQNNISIIFYCGQISLQSAALNCSFSDNLTPVVVPFILLAKEHEVT